MVGRVYILNSTEPGTDLAETPRFHGASEGIYSEDAVDNRSHGDPRHRSSTTEYATPIL